MVEQAYINGMSLAIVVLKASMPVDPSYPLFPIVSISCSALVLMLLATMVARQSWNYGTIFLCFWLFLHTLTLDNGLFVLRHW